MIDYASDLSQYNFNDRATSCCFNGIWILFDETNYNQNNLKVTNSLLSFDWTKLCASFQSYNNGSLFFHSNSLGFKSQQQKISFPVPLCGTMALKRSRLPNLTSPCWCQSLECCNPQLQPKSLIAHQDYIMYQHFMTFEYVN